MQEERRPAQIHDNRKPPPFLAESTNLSASFRLRPSPISDACPEARPAERLFAVSFTPLPGMNLRAGIFAPCHPRAIPA
jgi:hypothetical protein